MRSSVKCGGCGLVNWAAAETCKRCGAGFFHDREPSYAGPEPGPDNASPSEATDAGYEHPHEPYAWQDQHGHDGAQEAQYDQYAPHGWQPPTGGYGNPVPPAKKRTGGAMASLVLGIIGFFTFGIAGLGALVGTIVGIVALSNAKKKPQEYGGEGLAIAGIATNVLALMMAVPVAIIMAIAIPNLLASRRAANEASAIQTLRTLSAAEATYQSTVGSGSYGTLDDLARTALVDPGLAGKTKHGYRFDVRLRESRRKDDAFEAVATPLDSRGSGATGSRSFYVAEDGVIRGAVKHGLEADMTDPPLDFSGDSDWPAAYRKAGTSPRSIH